MYGVLLVKRKGSAMSGECARDEQTDSSEPSLLCVDMGVMPCIERTRRSGDVEPELPPTFDSAASKSPLLLRCLRFPPCGVPLPLDGRE